MEDMTKKQGGFAAQWSQSCRYWKLRVEVVTLHFEIQVGAGRVMGILLLQEDQRKHFQTAPRSSSQWQGRSREKESSLGISQTEAEVMGVGGYLGGERLTRGQIGKENKGKSNCTKKQEVWIWQRKKELGKRG